MEKIEPVTAGDPYDKSFLQPSMENFREYDLNQVKEVSFSITS